MRVLIKITRPSNDTWSVALHYSGNVSKHDLLRKAGRQHLSFPELDSADIGLRAEDVEALSKKIFANNANANEGAELGQHLFKCLFDPDQWSPIQAMGDAGDSLELALSWDSSEAELNSLPWELLNDGENFLCAQGVAITRLVDCAKKAPLRPTLTPKVLFVIGAALNDLDIRPGGEYLGLIKRLHGKKVSLNSRVLIPKSLDEIGKSIAEFNPSVIHFIGHGRDGKLQVSVPDRSKQFETFEFDAEKIKRDWLDKATSTPMFVLSACQSAAQPPEPHALPLALKLIQMGVPLAVGMSGRVSDAACRYFCWRFYESLLDNVAIPHGVAQARMAAGLINANLGNEPHWAFPVLFMRADVDPSVTLDQASLAVWVKQSTIASKYNDQRNPLLFCGRLNAQSTFHQILNPNDTLKILAAEVLNPDQEQGGPRYGKSRLLRELAEQAVLNGCIVVSVSTHKAISPPTTCLSFAQHLKQAFEHARKRFGIPVAEYSLASMVKFEQNGDESKLPPTLRDQYEGYIGHDLEILLPQMYGEALRHDAKRLRDDAPEWCKKIVLMIDDLHRFDNLAYQFFNFMLTDDGVGDAEIPIPFVFTYSNHKDVKSSCSGALSAIEEYVSGRTRLVAHVPLEAFPHPDIEYLAYQQFLLSLNPPLVATTKNESNAFRRIHQHIQGVPSKMELNKGLWSNSIENPLLVAIDILCNDCMMLVEATEEHQLPGVVGN